MLNILMVVTGMYSVQAGENSLTSVIKEYDWVDAFRTFSLDAFRFCSMECLQNLSPITFSGMTTDILEYFGERS